MAFPFKIRFVWCCLCLVLCISGNTVTSSFEIQRGKVDTFTNLGCQKSNTCTEKRCAEYEAKCVDDKCERCRCKEDSATFLARNSTTIITYKCVKNENVIPESEPEPQFRLEKINKTSKRTNQCLTVVAVEQNYKIFGKGCNSSLNMHWIWTKNQQKTFLMNLMTLQCLEFLQCNQNTTEVVLKQCKKTDRRQYISVQADSPGKIFSRCDGKNYYLRLEEQESDVGYSSFGERIVGLQTKYLDLWTNSRENDLHLSDKPTTYNGCYRFQNENFMLYLDRKTCPKNPCSHEFFAPIFYENANCEVIWSESKILYSDNVQWQKLITETSRKLISIESKSSSVKMLKVYQNALNIFNSSLVRLAISCENEKNGNQNSVENQCLLLKFKSLLRTEEEILTKTPSPALTTTLTPRSTIQKTSLTKSSINTIAIAIAVTVLLLAVILIVTLFYFMCYRKHKRSVPSKNTENPVTDENSSPTVEELVESTNPPNNNSQPTPNQSQLYAKPHSQHEYQYVDAKDRTFALQPQSPKYEIPQSPTYEYPEKSQSQQYEYPSLGKPILKETIQQETDTTGIYTDTVGVNSGYTSLIRRPVNNNGDNGYTHLIDVQKRNEKAGARERSDKPDGLPNAIDGNVTPLKNTCEDSSNARGQKTNDEQSAKWRKDEADESPYVVPMDSQYTALVRPPVRNSEREDPGYESLIKNKK